MKVIGITSLYEAPSGREKRLPLKLVYRQAGISRVTLKEWKQCCTSKVVKKKKWDEKKIII